jgi:hypothetical protein
MKVNRVGVTSLARSDPAPAMQASIPHALSAGEPFRRVLVVTRL